jgi:hypothetical protein
LNLRSQTHADPVNPPAFRFEDFALLDDRPEEARELRERFDEVRVLG